ncbi:hypothetical protein D5018_07105 [Parashewanella curva]|uniref:Uncharacterized protein n=1 Tax=Parashewanella curva TaxID=2338552 RepID=A0A3L8PY94_9GAMM|nr:hypothetical protein [Parashewanella curva]RLV60417.1 hypothetical protein D5018_07105 [Parashewanella curva]
MTKLERKQLKKFDKLLKKVCKKQAKKSLPTLDAESSKKQLKKQLKKQRKKLTREAYRQLKLQFKLPSKKEIKQQAKQTVLQQLNIQTSQNDEQYSFESIPAISLTVPLKAKPCGGCPALKNGLCKCAIKKQNRKLDGNHLRHAAG